MEIPVQYRSGTTTGHVSYPLTLYDVVEHQLGRLARWANLRGDTSRRLDGLFTLLTREALTRPPCRPFPGLSRINPDGLPLQWSTCIGQEPKSVRFLCEAGIPGGSTESRKLLSLAKLNRACRQLGIPYPSCFDDVVLPRVFPTVGTLPSDWRGAIWFAVGAVPQAVLLKVYVNLMRDEPIKRWRRIGHILRDLGRWQSVVQLCQLSAQVSRDSWPVGLALDVLPDGSIGRIKAYFQSGAVRAQWVQRWYQAAGAQRYLPDVRALTDMLPQPNEDTYPEGAFFISTEFSRDDQLTLKTDVAIGRWHRREQEIIDTVRSLLEHVRLDGESYLSWLEALGIPGPGPSYPACHQLVGIGYEPDGSQHVNVYCEPPLPMHRRISP